MTDAIETTSKDPLDGLSGWLILVGLGLVISPLRIAFQIFPPLSEIFTSGAFEALTTPGSAAYHQFWAPIIYGEIIVNAAMLTTWLYTGLLFFKKKRQFPRWFIGILLFTLTFIVLDATSIRLVLPSEPIFDPDTTRNLIRTFVTSIIWVPYMLVSKRVSRTFVC